MTYCLMIDENSLLKPEEKEEWKKEYRKINPWRNLPNLCWVYPANSIITIN